MLQVDNYNLSVFSESLVYLRRQTGPECMHMVRILPLRKPYSSYLQGTGFIMADISTPGLGQISENAV